MLSTFTKHTIGRVRRRASTKQRSITLVVRSFSYRCRARRRSSAVPVNRAPVAAPCARTPAGTAPENGERPVPPGAAFCQVHGLSIDLHLVVVGLPHFFQNIAHLMHPVVS